jgi:hypothetical protein
MVLIEGIPVVAARLAAEQRAKEWLAETRRRVPKTIPTQTHRPPAAVKRSKAAA